MSPTLTVCLSANALPEPRLGGLVWVYMNWALGLREAGCRVYWLECVNPTIPADQLVSKVDLLRSRLEEVGLKDALVLHARDKDSIPDTLGVPLLTPDIGAQSDLLLSPWYGAPQQVIELFPRSALVDIDPGLLQIWMSSGQLTLPAYDVYFTIGETVGQANSSIPDCDLTWHYTPPPVALPEWPVVSADPSRPYTTVVNWWEKWVQFGDVVFDNSKRESFLQFLDLPDTTSVPLELAVCMKRNDDDWSILEKKGWSVMNAWDQLPGPFEYRAYVAGSRGEFSCAKPSCVLLQNAWVSDRTLCYLASGKPAVVQHTGPSSILPDLEGMLRFRTLDEATRLLQEAEADYDRHSAAARKLAEEHFDALKVVSGVLDRALA